MIATKLFLVITFGILYPLIIPIIGLALISMKYFYKLLIKKQKFDITFWDEITKFPIHLLIFSLFCQQIIILSIVYQIFWKIWFCTSISIQVQNLSINIF